MCLLMEGECTLMGLYYPYLAVEMFTVKYTVESPQKLTNPILLICIQKILCPLHFKIFIILK